MIEIPRTLARDFRVVLRRAVMTEAPRGPWPLNGSAQEAVLSGSTTSGPSLQLAIDRRYLRRALQLGFHDLQVHGDQSVVRRDERRVYLWVPLTEKAAEPAPANGESGPATGSDPLPLPERRTENMPAIHSNGQGPPEGRDSTPAASVLDPIVEAEALRGLLHEAASRSARLVAALKQQRRHFRAVQQAAQSLRQLQLDR